MYTIVYEPWTGLSTGRFSMSKIVPDFLKDTSELTFEASDITGSPFRGYGINTDVVSIYAGGDPYPQVTPSYLRFDPPGDGFTGEHLTFHLPYLFFGGDGHGIIAHPGGFQYFAAGRYELGTFRAFALPDQPGSYGGQGFDLYSDWTFAPWTYVGTPGGVDIFLTVSQVPEPSALFLLATVILLLARRRARQQDPKLSNGG